jgi:23S rRNA pseudouridine1911/1915/1917 synthase
MQELDILYEDNHLLVVNKPAGIATMGAESGPTVHSLAAEYLKKKYHKPGNVYVGIVSRLDAMTSGVLVLARTSKAASRLVPQFAAKNGSAAAKIYLAIVEGSVRSDEGVWEDYVRKDDEARRMRVVDSSKGSAKRARSRFVAVSRCDEESILAIQLLSGRKHQIRVQAAHRGHAVLGDRKYNARTAFPAGVALHSWRLQITHPTRRESMWFEAGLPDSWRGARAQRIDFSALRPQLSLRFDLPTDVKA